MHRTKVRVATDVLDANDTIARANRADFDRAGVRVVNLMSAPGAGKTELLERVLVRGLGELRVGVLEGDVRGSLDAERLSALDVPVAQLNTDPGFGGECHLDANMVRSTLGVLALDQIDVLVIENVGNLVCPAEFRVGEDARAMISSVTEGEDKPVKYPLMFRACELVVVNKIDLLPHLDFSLERFLANLDRVHPGVEQRPLALRPAFAGERGRRQRPLAHNHRVHELDRNVAGVGAGLRRMRDRDQPPAAREALRRLVAQPSERLGGNGEELLARPRACA